MTACACGCGRTFTQPPGIAAKKRRYYSAGCRTRASKARRRVQSPQNLETLFPILPVPYVKLGLWGY